MQISYAITVCNEYEEIQKLISTLMLNTNGEDEVIVLFDKKAGTAEVWEYLVGLQSQDLIKAYPKTFKGHFGDWKNYLSSLCTGDFIFQIDADEYPNEHLLETLPFILEQNKGVDVILVPRVNTVEGWVNWPDYQWRVYKNIPSVKWVNKVHERLDGFKEYATLPLEESYALYHPKKIERQEKQNAYYDTL